LEDRVLPSGTSAATEQLAQQYGQIPLSFEANQGQADAQVKFLAHGQGYGLFLTPIEAALTLSRPAYAGAAAVVDVALHLRLVGATATPQVTGVDRLAGVSNYFVGNDSHQWHTGVPTYAKVAYHAVYPGVDLIYYGNQQQLEYDFDLAPGADPHLIRLAFDGAEGLTADGNGNLIVHTAGGDVVEHAPVLYQEGPAGTHRIAGQFVLLGDDQVGFAVGTYDPRLRLIIDPTLAYSTYLGGTSGDTGYGIAVDAAGNAYVTGYTFSSDFPTTVGAFQTTKKGSDCGFITKLNATGTALVYSTYLGGTSGDATQAIAVDAAGDAYVTGLVYSSDFPTTAGAFQTSRRGTNNAFVTKLNATGTALVYSTYLGGNSDDRGHAIAVDAAGNAFVTGLTNSSSFPTTAGAFQRSNKGYYNAFVTKLNATGSALVYSTYLGGNGYDYGISVAVDAGDNAYLTGSTTSSSFPTTLGAFQTNWGGAFVTKLNATGTGLVYSTYLGGGDDGGSGIAVDANGNAYVTGATGSSNFPTTAGAFQRSIKGRYNAFVTKLNPLGNGLVYSTYLGGSGQNYGDFATGIAIDAAGDAYVTGSTQSTDFPTTVGAIQTSNKGSYNAFVTKLNATGTALAYSTYLGGSSSDQGNAIAVDAAANAYITGQADSADFPTSVGAFQTSRTSGANAFVTKISPLTPTHFRVDVPPSTTAGAAFSATVTVLDDANNVVLFYTGTVHFTTSDSQGILPADYTFTTGDQGVHPFTVTLKTAGRQTVTVTDTIAGFVSGTAPVTVTPADAATLTLSGFPSPITAGVAGNMTVTFKDAYGNVATGYTGTVHFRSSDGQAVLPGDYTFTAADAGTHTFTATLTKAGSQVLTATDTVNGALTSSQAGIVVIGADLDHFALIAPVVVTAGSPFDVTVLALDAFNNFATYTGTVSFTSTDNDSGVVLPPPYTLSADDAGAHVFRNGFTLITEGLQTLTVTDQATGISWSVYVLVKPGDAPHIRTGTVWTGPGNWVPAWLAPGAKESAPAKAVAVSSADDGAVPIPTAPATARRRARPIPAARVDPGSVEIMCTTLWGPGGPGDSLRNCH
jgi:hypothetical protein